MRRYMPVGLVLLLVSTNLHAAGCLLGPKGALDMPVQKAAIHFKDGKETLVLQVEFKGPADRFAWVIPTPARVKVSVLKPEQSPFAELGTFTRAHPWHRLSSAEAFSVPPEALPGRTAPVTVAAVVDSVEALKKRLAADGFAVPPAEALEHYAKKKWSFVVLSVDPSGFKPDRSGRRRGTTGPVRLEFATEQPVYPFRLDGLSRGDSDVHLYVMSDVPMLPRRRGGRKGFGNAGIAGSVPAFSRGTAIVLPRDMDPQYGTYKKLAWPNLHLPYLAANIDYGRTFYLCKFRRACSAKEMNDDLSFVAFDPAPYWKGRAKAAKDPTGRLKALLVLAGSGHASAEQIGEARRAVESQQKAQATAAAEKARPALLAKARSEDPRLRRQAAIALAPDDEALSTLAKDQAPDVRATVAARAGIPKEVLAELVKDAKGEVRLAAARNPALDAKERIRIIQADGTETDKCRLATQPDTSADVLEALAADKLFGVRRAVARNPKAPAELLAQLAKDKNASVRATVARSGATPAKVLGALAGDDADVVRQAVAANPNTPKATFGKLLAAAKAVKDAKGRWVNPIGRYVAARTQDAAALRILAGDKDEQVRVLVAGNSETPPDAVLRLARGASPKVGKALLSRPDLPPRILEGLLGRLSASKDALARRSAGGHWRCPTAALERLARDKDVRVRAAVAGNSGAPAKVLRTLSKDREAAVRYALSANGGTPPEILREFMKSPVYRPSLAKNPRLDAALLGELARSGVSRVKRALLANLSVPRTIVETMVRDVDVEIAHAAWKRLHGPPKAP